MQVHPESFMSLTNELRVASADAGSPGLLMTHPSILETEPGEILIQPLTPNGAVTRPITTIGSGSGFRAELLDEACRRVADLRTLALPVSEPLGFEAKHLLASRRFGIVKTDALYEAAVARALRIRNHQVEKRTLFGAAACQSDHYHGKPDPENAERA